ncbi:MAG: hypothetical protein IJX39_00900 [Clostridia bacterium]|nr:hypothetical protein [Clostridia bacterium]
MNRSVIYRIATTAVACVLGAGFVSGQELWQFFGAYGQIGIVGAGVAVLLFCFASAVVLWFSSDTGEGNMEGLIAPGNRMVQLIIAGFELLFHFILYVLMTAATGALGERYGLPFWVGCAFFCIVATAVSLLGFQGLMKVFGWLVPILAVAAIGVAIWSMTLPAHAIPAFAASGSPLTGNWLISSLVYFSFNFVGSVPILTAVGHDVTDRRGMVLGVLLAIVPLGGLAIFLLAAIMAHPGASAFELPMMELAAACGTAPGILYALLLLGGIFATGFSSQAAMNRYFEGFGLKGKKLVAFTAGLSAIAFLIGLLGFKDLVSVLYPVLGYIGILPLAIIFFRALLHFIKKRRQRT